MEKSLSPTSRTRLDFMSSKIEITSARYEQLEKNSRMLGQIAEAVSDFCDEEDSTLAGVLKVLSLYHQMKANELDHWRMRELNKNE